MTTDSYFVPRYLGEESGLQRNWQSLPKLHMRHCKVLIRNRDHLSSQTMLPVNRQHYFWDSRRYHIRFHLSWSLEFPLCNERGHDGLESLQPVHGCIRACCGPGGFDFYCIRSLQLGYCCAKGFNFTLHSCSTSYYR